MSNKPSIVVKIQLVDCDEGVGAQSIYTTHAAPTPEAVGRAIAHAIKSVESIILGSPEKVVDAIDAALADLPEYSTLASTARTS